MLLRQTKCVRALSPLWASFLISGAPALRDFTRCAAGTARRGEQNGKEICAAVVGLDTEAHGGVIRVDMHNNHHNTGRGTHAPTGYLLGGRGVQIAVPRATRRL